MSIQFVQVMFNQAFALTKLGRTAEAMDELHKAKSKSATTSESRHKIISPALDNMMVSYAGTASLLVYERECVCVCVCLYVCVCECVCVCLYVFE